MRTAPRGETQVLACVRNNLGKLVAVPAIWGQPDGYVAPGWWAISFSLVTGDPMRDMRELRGNLIPIMPVYWKPWPEGKSS